MYGASKRVSLRKLRDTFHSQGMRSGREIAIEQFLMAHGYKTEHSVREYGTEFDLYLRKQHVAFEFNGIAYHFHRCNHRVKGRRPKDKDYHRKKSLLALYNGILLYHFWDFEPIDEVKLSILKILRGEELSSVNADKNPSLLGDVACKLEPRWVLPEKHGFLKENFPYDTKPLCWSDKDVTIYEYYNAGYVRV